MSRTQTGAVDSQPYIVVYIYRTAKMLKLTSVARIMSFVAIHKKHEEINMKSLFILLLQLYNMYIRKTRSLFRNHNAIELQKTLAVHMDQ